MEKVLNYLINELKLKENDIIVVGNSGGPDSMALTNILLNVQKKLPIKIICAHVNHNVRKESYAEAKFLKDFCLEKGITFEHMTIEKYGDDNFHNEARTIRYNFFKEVIKKYHAKYLMTAHHGDDLIETILMRIVRGSSLHGYGGFELFVEKDDYFLVRPMLFVTKEEIEKYNNDKKIPFVIDQSNFKDTYTRNRYRKTVLPFLKQEDSKVHERFLKFSQKIFEYDQYMDMLIKKQLKKVYGNNVLNIPSYKQLEPIIQYNIIYKILEQYYVDDLMLVHDAHVSLINDLIYSKKANSYVYLPNNLVATKSYDCLEIKPNIDDIFEYEIEFNNYAKLPNGHIIDRVESECANDNNVCRLSEDEIVFPLYIRTRRTGDKMALKKVGGYRKIKDIFIDSKIKLNERDKWPIVVDSKGTILWIPGIKKSKFTKSKKEKYDIILRYR